MRGSGPCITTSLVRPLTIPPFALHLSAVLARIRAKVPSALALAIFGAALDAVPNTFYLTFFCTGTSCLG
jgi:hypothetical protein